LNDKAAKTRKRASVTAKNCSRGTIWHDQPRLQEGNAGAKEFEEAKREGARKNTLFLRVIAPWLFSSTPNFTQTKLYSKGYKIK